jgi:hypothetical protein
MGAPLAGVEVVIYDQHGVYVRTVATRGDGVYTSGDLDAGIYYARTDNDLGFVNELYSNILCAACDVTSGTSIGVVADSIHTGIDFSLSFGRAVSGTVTDGRTGDPLGGVVTEFYTSAGGLVTSATTDGSGAYVSAAGLPAAAEYYVLARSTTTHMGLLYDNHPCDGCDVTGGDPITIGFADVDGVDFQLMAGGVFTGRITDAVTGLPLADVDVHAYTSDGDSYIVPGTSNADGEYVSGVVPAGTVFAATDNPLCYLDQLWDGLPVHSTPLGHGATIPVAAGEATRDIDFALVRAGSISGTVTTIDGTPLDFTTVRAYRSNGEWAAWDWTSADGTFRICDLTTGSYFVSTDHTGSELDELYHDRVCEYGCDPATGTAVPVVEGLITPNIDFVLATGGSVSGVVRDSFHAPLENAKVTVYDATGVYLVDSERTVSDGSYLVEALETGVHYVHTMGFEGQIAEVYDDLACLGECDLAAGSPVTVTAGLLTPGIDIDLDDGLRILGAVTEEGTGRPIEDALIYVYDAAGDQVAHTYSVADGSYATYQGVPPGPYFVRTAFAGYYVNEWYEGGAVYDSEPCRSGCDLSAATPVLVTSPGGAAGVDFELRIGGRIQGQVKNADTLNQLSDVEVQVFDGARNLVMTVWTARIPFGGWIDTGSLPPGTYYVRTARTSGFIDELYDGHPCPTGCDPLIGDPVVVPSDDRIWIGPILLEPDPGFLFADGFESGSTSGWSTSAP